MEKGDPFALHWEIPSRTASIIWDLKHSWNDAEWMKTRADKNSLSSPLAIYEMHLGSWKRVPEDNNRSLTYRETAHDLPSYLEELHFRLRKRRGPILPSEQRAVLVGHVSR